METNNVNQNVEELTDDQLKEVAGGMLAVHICAKILNNSDCVKTDKDCHCTKCAEGFVLVSGKCEYQR